MKPIALSAVLFLSMPVLADETVEVTGSRIFETTPFGPNIKSPGDRPHPCAQPSCGQMPSDEKGPAATTQVQKTASNKKAKEKAKQNKDKLASAMKTDTWLLGKMFEWMEGVAIDLGAKVRFRVTTPGGTIIEGEGCLQHHSKLNPGSQESKDYCTQREVAPETVKRANGTNETQLNLTYKIYDTCYWEKTCGVETITFLAGSTNELRNFLNETLEEQYY